MAEKRIILMDPHPRPLDLIFSQEDRRRLGALGDVLWHEGSPAPQEHVDRHLPHAIAIVADPSELEPGSHTRSIPRP